MQYINIEKLRKEIESLAQGYQEQLRISVDTGLENDMFLAKSMYTELQVLRRLLRCFDNNKQ